MTEQPKNLDLLTRIEKLNSIGIALSAEKDTQRLLEMILAGAKAITQADGGTLYSLSEDNRLHFEIIRTTSLNIKVGGTTGRKVNFDPIPMFLPDGAPNDHMVVVYAALNSETVNIPDVYDEKGFDFSGPRAFDKETGYRSKSFLTIPMKNHENDTIGVLQLINKHDDEANKIVAFNREDQKLAESLASQAAVALTNSRLIKNLHELFNAFTKSIAFAIDEKSPYTGGHCNRVPVLAMMLADKASQVQTGPLKSFTMSEDERYTMELASWLHDCGKVTTPEYIVDKATKLETIFDRIHLIDTRFEVLKRDACIRKLERLAKAGDNQRKAIEDDYKQEIRQIEEDRAFIRKCNTGGEFMAPEDQKRIMQIGAQTWTSVQGETEPFLSGNEIYNLQIPKGTLTPEEIQVIKNHVVMTHKMLAALPFPKNLKNVPEYAGGHHERMDGKGYPNGLTREQMSIPARIMAIADIFEALTAADRPYKKAKKLSESLNILGFMKKDNHIDQDLFDIFINERVYLAYAREYLDPEQIDIDDPSGIPGYPFN